MTKEKLLQFARMAALREWYTSRMNLEKYPMNPVFQEKEDAAWHDLCEIDLAIQRNGGFVK